MDRDQSKRAHLKARIQAHYESAPAHSKPAASRYFASLHQRHPATLRHGVRMMVRYERAMGPCLHIPNQQHPATLRHYTSDIPLLLRHGVRMMLYERVSVLYFSYSRSSLTSSKRHSSHIRRIYAHVVAHKSSKCRAAKPPSMPVHFR